MNHDPKRRFCRSCQYRFAQKIQVWLKVAGQAAVFTQQGVLLSTCFCGTTRFINCFALTEFCDWLSSRLSQAADYLEFSKKG